MSEVAEMKQVVDGLGKAFEEFKAANDTRLKEVEKGKGEDPILAEKLAKINTSLDGLEEIKKRLEDVEVKQNRRKFNAGDDETVEQTEHKMAFEAFVRKGNDDGLADVQKKAMSVGSDPDGGYLVPTQMESTIIKTIFESSPIRAYANVMSITGDAVEMLVDKDEVSVGWVGETESRAETTTPDLAKVRIVAHEIYAEPRVTQKLLDDASFNVESFLAQKVADKFARTEATAFLTGTGSNRPRGLLTYASGTTWGQIERVKTGVNGDWAASNKADKLVELLYSLKTPYLTGAAWMFRRSLLAEVRQFKGSDNNYLWQPSLQAGQPSTLLGYPVVMAEDMPSKATGSLSVAFGNFREGYTIVDRQGVSVLRDPYTAKPYVKFYTTKRVGGDVTNFEAIKLLEFSA